MVALQPECADRPLAARFRILLAALLVCLAPSQSQSTSLDDAQSLVAPGREDTQPASQANLLPSFSDERRNRWMLAQGHLRRGSPQAALPYLERLVTELPGEARLRLELAYALFLLKEDDRARYHFEQAVGGDLSARERATAEAILSRIDRRKTWESRLHFAVVPQTNPSRQTNTETIAIGGYEFRLRPEARAQPGIGFQAGGSLVWTPKLSRDARARLSFVGFSETYEESSFNDVVLRFEAGLLKLQDGGGVGGGFLLEHRRLADTTFYRGPGVYLTYDKRLAPKTRFGLRAEFKSLRYPSLSHRDGSSASIHLRLSQALNSRLALEGAAFGRRIEAKYDFNSLTEGRVSLSSHYAFESGLLASLEVFLSQSSRRGELPLFGKERADKLWGASIRLRSRNLTIGGFAPTLGLTYERQQSTIDLYDYKAIGASFSLSREF